MSLTPRMNDALGMLGEALIAENSVAEVIISPAGAGQNRTVAIIDARTSWERGEESVPDMETVIANQQRILDDQMVIKRDLTAIVAALRAIEERGVKCSRPVDAIAR